MRMRMLTQDATLCLQPRPTMREATWSMKNNPRSFSPVASEQWKKSNEREPTSTHNAFTHFHKDPKFETCRMTKIARARFENRTWNAQWWSGSSQEIRWHNHGGFQSTGRSAKRRKVCNNPCFLCRTWNMLPRPFSAVRSCFAQIGNGIIIPQHIIALKTYGTAERAVRSDKERTASSLGTNLVSQKGGGARQWNVAAICVTYMVSWPTVKPLIKNDSMLHSV